MNSPNPITEHRIASIISRPIRFGFVVNRNISAEQLRLVFQTNCLFWGGFFNLYVPTDGNYIREDWWKILCYHDPDIVIYVGDIDDSLIEKIYVELQPFNHFTWYEEWLNPIYDDVDHNGVSVWSLFRHQLDKTGVLDAEKSNCIYPIIGNSKYAQFYELLYGTYPKNLKLRTGKTGEDLFRGILSAADLECTPQTLSDHIQIIRQEKKVSPLYFTRQFLDIHFSSDHMIYYPTGHKLIISDGSLDDLFIFHALRWYQNPAFVMVDDIKSDDNLGFLAEQYGLPNNGNVFGIGSMSLELDHLREIRERIRPYLLQKNPSWHIDISRCNIGLRIATLIDSEKKQQLVTVQNNIVTFDPPQCKLSENLAPLSRWVAEVNLSPRIGGDRNGFIPSIFPDLNFLLSGIQNKEWYYGISINHTHRIARWRVAVKIGEKDHLSKIYLPTDNQLFFTLIENGGYSVKDQDNKGRIYKNMVQLAGSLSEIKFLRNGHMLQLFDAISNEKARHGEKRRFLQRFQAYTLDEMLKLAASGNKENRDDFTKRLQVFAGKRIFFRGYNLKCPHCHLKTWYQLKELEEWTTCKGCYETFQIDVRGANFAYQLNQLFLEGFLQGGMAVILTTLLLYDLSLYSFIWQSGYEVKKDDKSTDIDLIAMCDGALILAECKNSFDDTKPEKIKELLDQIIDNIKVAESLNADIFFFATLHQKSIPQEIVEFIERYNSQPQHLTVKIIQRSELLEGKLLENNRLGDLVKQLPSVSGGCHEDDPDNTDVRMLTA